MVCGGKARDFFGEYMAGGILVLLGMNTQFAEQPLVGGFCGTGMHGGVIYLRGEVEPWQVGKECGIFTADEDDMADARRPILADYCEALGMDARRGPRRAVHEARAGEPPAVREAVRVPVAGSIAAAASARDECRNTRRNGAAELGQAACMRAPVVAEAASVARHRRRLRADPDPLTRTKHGH